MFLKNVRVNTGPISLAHSGRGFAPLNMANRRIPVLQIAAVSTLSIERGSCRTVGPTHKRLMAARNTYASGVRKRVVYNNAWSIRVGSTTTSQTYAIWTAIT